jgi:hypothetical protein
VVVIDETGRHSGTTTTTWTTIEANAGLLHRVEAFGSACNFSGGTWDPLASFPIRTVTLG